ncbi:MAG: helix-turn-helix transcriptional regulator, partial [Thermocrispum sp.]
RARHQSLQAMIERCGLDDLDAAEATARGALEKARASGDPLATAHSLQDLWQIESVLRRHPEALDFVDLALDVLRGQPELGDLQLSLLDNRVFTLQNLDRLAEATSTLSHAQDLVARRGMSGGLHIPAAVHYYWLARWDDAIAQLEAVVQDGPEITFYGLRQRGAILLLHGAAALIAGMRGDTAELAAHLRAADDYPLATVADREHCDFLIAAAAVAAEQRGRPEEALAVFVPTLDRKYAQMMLRHQWLPTVVRLALQVGDNAIAQQALGVCEEERELEEVPARATSAAAWCRGLIERDADALRAVAAGFHRSGRRLEYATVLEDAAVLLADAGDLDAAREALRESMVVYTQVGAAWCVTRAEQRLRPYNIRRASHVLRGEDPRLLTPVELRIAELVADGWPNADIAGQLVLSRPTVQAHVTRLVGKLGVDSRLGITREAIARYRSTAVADRELDAVGSQQSTPS